MVCERQRIKDFHTFCVIQHNASNECLTLLKKCIFAFMQSKTNTRALFFIYVMMVLVMFLTPSCSTYKSQFGKNASSIGGLPTIDTSKIVHQIYFTAGLSKNKLSETNLYLKNLVEKKGTNASLVFLGNYREENTNLSKSNDSISDWKSEDLNPYFIFSKDFKGNTFFIPGKKEWQPNGHQSILNVNKIMKLKTESQNYLTPKNGCGLEIIQLHESIVMITIDSQWFLEDWNPYANMNAGCQSQTREMLIEELSFELSQNQNKTVILAMHHPIFSNGISGGQTHLSNHLYVPNISFPLPIFATFYHTLNKAAGWESSHLQNANYRQFANQIKNEIKKYKNIVVISGKEKNLQYINKEGIHQLISGSGDEFEPVRAIQPKDYSYGGNGFGELNIYESGAVKLSFQSVNYQKPIELFSNFILTGKPIDTTLEIKKFVKKVNFSIDEEGTLKRGKFYRFLWGKHHQNIYQTPFEANVTDLDNLYGGLVAVGLERYGTSSFWVFASKKGKKYWAIPLKKEANDFLQTQIFQTQNDKNSLQKKASEEFFEDFFTTTYPFAALITASFEQKIGLKTAQPNLFYISNTKTIEIGDQRMKSGHYLLTEKPDSQHQEKFGLGEKDYILNTDDMLFALKTEYNHRINKEAYIKSRLLDFLVGDWNRNPAFYRWIAKTKDHETIYEPLPFQRDQAFAKYDGFLLGSLKKLPGMGAMFSYQEKWPNLYLFNEQGFALDNALLNQTTAEEWVRIAKKMQSELNFDEIQNAFQQVPIKVQNSNLEKYAYIFKNKLNKLDKKARKYAQILAKRPVIIGTTKPDKIKISVIEKGFVQITIHEVENPKNISFDKIFNKKQTKEIVIYGLEGDDVFEGQNTENCSIKMRLIGGQGTDQYNGLYSKKIHLYDFESNTLAPENQTTSKTTFDNDYDTNIYQNQIIRKPKIDAAPLLGFNPDDGLRLGTRIDLTTFGIGKKPYSQHHFFETHYYFATEGYDLQYGNVIKNAFKKWDFVLNAKITSANFAVNFFGFGNESINPDDNLGLDYNRVKMRTTSINPGLRWQDKTGNEFSAVATFQAFEVDNTPNRFIENTEFENNVFDLQSFIGWKTKYQFSNQDKTFDPTLGFRFFTSFSWQTNIRNIDNQVPTISTGIWAIYSLLPNQSLLLETRLEGKRILSNQFEFYQAATLGGDADLRGFRDQRFTGKNSFFQQSNLRASIGQIKNPFVPIYYGVQVGFDYGRVWMPLETSTKWHQSFGGGIWFKAAQLIMGNVAYFQSSDGGRLSFRMIYNF